MFLRNLVLSQVVRKKMVVYCVIRIIIFSMVIFFLS